MDFYSILAKLAANNIFGTPKCPGNFGAKNTQGDLKYILRPRSVPLGSIPNTPWQKPCLNCSKPKGSQPHFPYQFVQKKRFHLGTTPNFQAFQPWVNTMSCQAKSFRKSDLGAHRIDQSPRHSTQLRDGCFGVATSVELLVLDPGF